MAKTSVLSRPLPDQHLPRNTFDRSFFINMNWSSGMLLPVFCQFVPVGSSGSINRSIFMRTAAVNTAAFPKLDTHIDFYKVPLKLLMSRYNEFKLNISDCNSSGLINGTALDDPPQTLPFMEWQVLNQMADITGSGQSTDIVGDRIGNGVRRLADLLGYNDKFLTWSQSQQSDIRSMRLQTFRFQAYQKVYYDHYRNTAYEGNNPFAYNADFLYSQQSRVSLGEYGINDMNNGLLTLRYVNYRKDFFQNIYPALNYVVSHPSGQSWSIPSNISGASSAIDPNSWAVRSSLGSTEYPSIVQNAAQIQGNSQAITVQSIRALFALDKLMRLSAYAPKHVKDQLQSRFGVSVSAASSYESQYLGSFKNDIVIGEVTSTADTEQISPGYGEGLGAIGGRGVGGEQRGKDIHFEVTGDDGDSIIIGVMYSLARSVYDANRLDAFNFKFTREDLFNPEFMDLGLRPVTLKEVYTPLQGATLAQLNTILGYVPRDQEYKLGIDENHGLFKETQQLSIFTNHTNTALVQRGHTLGTAGVNASWFKMAPSDLDSIFVTVYDADDQSTDQFFGNIEFKFISRQNMSVHGQPRL